MVLGSYVSAAGLGLSCVDWPTCRGTFLPSEEIMAEWVHRLFALMAGVSVITMAALSWRVRNSRLRLTATLAAVFVVTQIVLGIIVIDSRLHPLVVSIHLAIGTLLFACTLLSALTANRIYRESMQSVK
ncbi:MAG: COX15/CtaA family protein [Candidatus Nitrosocaldus sp.]|nr:COX15/CtaA family protein [Candidatus Nitrosocaldus sp.]MCS7141244.1 COX15/CtaA family protein [Candidatus Nitrosocaldus sp.]MDW8000150.1 COX15/CtaA family protein [Candidatus Nitrosocaldus sp.]MDW8275604.1 COX15/CtaA family protein [Candidatus Nitrosocaldus sp.]